MKKTLLLLSLIFGLLSSIQSQVTSVDFQLKYNDDICEYDAYIIINAGTATTIPQRILFNTQYSIIVPTGTALSVTESYMPLLSNATYTGTTPMTWSAGTPIISPGAQPESDFYSITPDLGITGHFNDLTAGDTIKIFSIAVDTIFNCSQGIRIFENGIDPDSNAPGMGLADFTNGITMGNINQIYNGNSPQAYPSEPEVISIVNSCSNGLEIDLTAETSACQGPMTYAWTGPDGYTSDTEDVNITPALPSNNGVYEVVITDAFGCKDSITIDATSKPDAGPDFTVCSGSTTTINGTMPTTGTWAQAAGNAFGASLSPLAGGVTEVTFSTFASGTYDMVYSIPGCLDTMTFTVNPAPLVNIEASSICENAMTVAASNIPGGTWVSNNVAVATVNPNTGVITGQSSGTVTLTYTAPTGCTATTSSLIVNPGPTVSVTGATTICVGGITFVTPTSGGTWSSSDPTIATVTNAGVVVGISPGTVTFTFTDTFTGCTSDGLDIIVTALPVATFTGSDSICINGTTTLTPATGGTWVSSNPIVATIDNSGNVTAQSVGTVTFTHTNLATGCSSLTSDTLWVLDSPTVAITGDDRLCIGETSTLSPNTGGTWVSNNISIATVVASTGIVTAVSQGAGTFTFTDAVTGCTATTLTIIVDPIPATLLTGPNQICIGETTNIEPNTGGTWASADNTIATVDNFGNITGVGAGVTIFTYTSASTLCTSDPSEPVQVAPAPIVTAPQTELCITESMSLSPAFGGTWTSSNPAVATVNAFTGLVTAIGAGNTVFTFTDAVSGCSASTDVVTVYEIPIVEFTAPDTICVGFTTTVSPSLGGTWVSNNPTIATVDNLGNVTGVSAGTANLIYTDTNTGCTSATLTVTVLSSTPVSITGDDELCIGETSTVSPTTGGVWSSSDPSVLTITNAGLVTAVGPGQATFTFTSGAGQCTSAETDPITVNGSQTIVLDDTELCIGESTTATTTAIGTWVSSDPAVATIDANTGVITAIVAGTVRFTFTNTTTTCVSNESEELTVFSFPTVSITGTDEICIGETTQMFPSVGGTWTSSDPSVFTITNTGLVTGVSTGTATGTFTPDDSGCPSLPSELITVSTCLGSEMACDQIEANNIYCDFDVFGLVEGTLPSSNFAGNQPLGTLCDDGDEVQNISWFGFVALEGEYDIVINTTNCNLNTETYFGAEVGVYSDCTFTGMSRVFCEKGTELENQARISSNLLTPGQTYFLYIDGYGGSVCDYSITVDGFYDNTFCTDLSKVTGVAYIDDNENGVYDVDEVLLRNALISLSPGNFSVLTNEEGMYIINTPKGGVTLTAKMNEGQWINDELTIEDLTIFETCVEGINFGFVPNLFYQEAKVSVANSITRCDWETKFYFTVENTGTIDLDANFEFEFDDKASYFTTNHIGLQVSGNVASGNLGVMAPFEVREFWITLKMPSGSSVLPILDFKTTLYNKEGEAMDEYDQSEQLRCSYDPNDKREFPNREGDENLTLMDEDLEYTIRFQNNGNDTAFLVKIIDPLDPNIDPTSIRVINSSHSVETCIEDDYLIFMFENINLVDSMTNNEGSQGYVSFRCNAKEDRLENTIVHNTADIIFDTNIPIVTNTTINTLVSELCTYVSSEVDVEICDGDNYNGYEESGTYTEIFPLEFGCDSTVIINLEVQEITYSSQSIEICEGEAFDINGEEYILYESQVVRDSIENAQGCISNVVIYNVDVNPIMLIDIDTIICEGYEYNGLSESGIYTIESFDEVTGCDIITTIDLEVLPLGDPSCIVGIADLDHSDVKIYPIPARDVFFLEGDAIINAVSIYTMNYQKVEELQFASGLQKVQLSTDKLSQGLYIIAIESKGQIIYKKLIVE